MAKYKTKPFEVEAVQWTGENGLDLNKFSEGGFNFGNDPQGNAAWAEVYDYLQQTWVNVNMNDFIIRGSKGEYYPCDPEVFNAKYERIAE